MLPRLLLERRDFPFFLLSVSISHWVLTCPAANADLFTLWFATHEVQMCILQSQWSSFFNFSYSTSYQGHPCTLVLPFRCMGVFFFFFFFSLVDSRATQEGGVYSLWFKVIAERCRKRKKFGIQKSLNEIIWPITVFVNHCHISSVCSIITSIVTFKGITVTYSHSVLATFFHRD